MSKNNNTNEIDMTGRDNLNKEKAVNSFRMNKYKKSKNLTLAVTLTFLGLTIASTAMFLTGVFPLSVGSTLSLIGAMATATGASLFAKKNSAYKNCVAQEEYYNQVEDKITKRKAAELAKIQQEEKERKIKEQKAKQSKKKTNKQLLREGKIKVASEYKKPKGKIKQFSNSAKENKNSHFTNNQQPSPALTDKKNEQIKDINSFLDSGK